MKEERLYSVAMQCAKLSDNCCEYDCGHCQYNIFNYLDDVREASLLKANAYTDFYNRKKILTEARARVKESEDAYSFVGLIFLGLIVWGLMWCCSTMKSCMAPTQTSTSVTRQQSQNSGFAAVEHAPSRDKYGLLASDYDRNGWAQVNGKWVSNPREGATVRYSTTQRSTVTTTSVNHNSQHANIDRTLRLVAENWKRTDVNGDGLNNCIDAAVLFYQYFPDKSKVRILSNRNPNTDFYHLFNSIRIDGIWMAIEPQAYASNYYNYSMSAVWGNIYDQSYNRDATNDYLVYVR
jgi:hypothetical protein